MTIDLNTHHLMPWTLNQAVQVYVTGGDQVAGMNLNITTGAGTLTRVDGLSGIFAGGNESLGIYLNGSLAIDYVATLAGSVSATGLVATVWIDTGAPGGYSFDLLNTPNGPTEFITWPGVQVIIPTQADVTMTVDATSSTIPEPGTLAVLGLGLLIHLRKERRHG
jgi:hypothetical protein